MTPNVILWIYIGLLVAGGLAGFIKAKSKVSLITSLAFAALLALCATGIIAIPYLPDILLGLLAIVFGMRWTKTKKFMPSGFLLILTVVVLVLRHLPL